MHRRIDRSRFSVCLQRCSLGVLALVAAPASFAQTKIPHAELAKRFVVEHGFPEAAPETVKADELLKKGFARLELGAFDLYYPRAYLAEAPRAEQLKRLAQAIFALQTEWLALLAPEETPESKTRAKEIEALAKWIDSWKAKDVATAAATEGVEIAGAMPAKEPQREALKHMNAAWHADGDAAKPRCRMAFSPSRKHFIGFGSWIGSTNDGYKASYWLDGIATWTEFYMEDAGNLRILALEYASPKKDARYEEGFDMDSKSPTGMLQHVIQQASELLCERTFGKEVNPFFRAALSQNLVIALYGENNSRLGGSGKSKSTAEYGSFIPGGNSAGGLLPTLSADNHFRENLGKDYFVRTLRMSQKRGAKEDTSGGPSSHAFVLHGTDDQDHQVVNAPFFGKGTKEPQAIPVRFNDDYLEFLRAYKSCFLHWLQHIAGGNKKHGPVRFAEMMRGMEAEDQPQSWEDVLQKVYGAPLRVEEPKGDSLEFRFLEWLEKQ